MTLTKHKELVMNIYGQRISISVAF